MYVVDEIIINRTPKRNFKIVWFRVNKTLLPLKKLLDEDVCQFLPIIKKVCIIIFTANEIYHYKTKIFINIYNY